MLAVVEMNLEEYPAFRLGRRSKRPELQYVRTRTEPDGRTLRQTWTVRGAEGLGLPGPFEQDLYVALLVLFTEQGLPDDGRIRFTRNRLAQVMGTSNSGRGYELMEQGLARLAGATVYTEHAFYRPGPVGKDGERSGPAERLSLTFHILEEVRVYERRAAALETSADAPDSDDGALRRRVEHARPMELSVARLGQPLVQSYERRYTKGLDATYYFSLTRPLGKRLYRYLDKVRNGRGSFEIGLRGLADVLGLEYRYPSDIKDGLVEAHAELQATGYLAAAGYAPLAGGPGAGEKVVYGIDPAFDRRPRRRAGAALHVVKEPSGGGGTPRALTPGPSPTRGEGGVGGRSALSEGVPQQDTKEKSELQVELEEFGMTPVRARALVEGYSEAHVRSRVEYVRALMGRRTAGVGAKPAIKNPAGLLARAIEQSYVVPDVPTPARPVAAAARGDARPPAVDALTRREAASTGTAVNDQEAAERGTSPRATAAESVDGTGMGENPVWAKLAGALRERVSGATYAAWIAPARPAAAAEGPEADGALTLVLPTAFALDRWRREPIAAALRDASAAVGVRVTLEVVQPT